MVQVSLRRTTVAERNRIIDLKLQGCTLREIAMQTGWSFEFARKWWRQYQKAGRKALRGERQGKPARGAMSSFPCRVRFACLRLKKQHPGWEADVVRLHTPFALWLAGLGIAHDLARSAQDNGCIERANRTWWERVILGRTVHLLNELQQISDEELEWINAKLPSKGRECAGRTPLAAYPQAQQPRRSYSRETEVEESFSIQRVYEFLSSQFWWRRVSNIGQITISGRQYGVGISWRGQDV